MYPVDMHTHTSHYSTCGHQTIEELLQAAHRRSLHAVCITEHAYRWTDEDLVEVVRRLGLEGQLTALGGEELACYARDGTRQGDYLVFGPTHRLEGTWDVRELIPYVHEIGGIVIGAHSMRAGYNSDRIVYELDLDALEIHSKNHKPEEAAKALECARTRGLLPVCCSDGHRAEHVGMYFTYFAEPVASVADLIRQIKARRVRSDCGDAIATLAAGQ